MGKIVLIYPSNPEKLDLIPQEAATVANLLGNVILVPLLYDESPIGGEIDAALRSGGVSGLWFAGHADGQEVLLGAVSLNIWAIVQYVQASRAEWVFFNVCHGDRFTKLLQMATGVTTIAVDKTANGTGEIEDDEAWRTAINFARALKRNNFDVRAAFTDVSPRGASNYIFREGFQGDMMGNYSQPGETQPNSTEDTRRMVDPAALHAIDMRLTVLETQLKYQTEAILAEVSELKKEIAELKRSQNYANNRPAQPQPFDRATWGMLLASMLVSGLFFAGLTVMIYTLGGG